MWRLRAKPDLATWECTTVRSRGEEREVRISGKV
jgi:hypothetical protein